MNHDATTFAFCPIFQEALQRFLDGDARAFSAACESHRAICSACQADYRAALRLAEGLKNSVRPLSPTGLTDRLAAAVLADMAQPARFNDARQTRWLVVLAVAACLSLGLGIGLRSTKNAPQPEPRPKQLADVNRQAPVALDNSLAEAGSAVASLTRRTADQTVEPARKLISSAADSPILKVDPIPNAIDPASQSLTTIRQGAALGFEPMANSARRAVSMFLRDLPFDIERKPN